MKKTEKFNSITEFLLGPVRKRPGMFLKEPKLSRLTNFIFAMQMGYEIGTSENRKEDIFFGDNGFYTWLNNEKGINIQKFSFIEDSFLELTNNDEKQALNLFFELLEEFYNYRTKKNC